MVVLIIRGNLRVEKLFLMALMISRFFEEFSN
jgi:hypothetical protein